MKFEQFGQLEQALMKAVEKYPKKKVVFILAYGYAKFLDYHRQKLKLGKLVFEIREINMGEFTLHETVDIRYTRQDNTQEDELRIDNRLAALDWQWDLYNVLAFLFVMWGMALFFYVQYLNWYNENLYFLKDGNYQTNVAREYVYETCFRKNYSITKRFRGINAWLNAVLLDMCERYKMLR